MSYHLFLDDIRLPGEVTWVQLPTPLEPWKIVRNFDQFVSAIKCHGLPEFIAFDHDLSYEHYLTAGEETINYSTFGEKTGLDCAKWLVEYCRDLKVPLPRYVVHSMNPAGCRNIESYLDSYSRISQL